jgi:hypothetical protein
MHGVQSERGNLVSRNTKKYISTHSYIKVKLPPVLTEKYTVFIQRQYHYTPNPPTRYICCV